MVFIVLYPSAEVEKIIHKGGLVLSELCLYGLGNLEIVLLILSWGFLVALAFMYFIDLVSDEFDSGVESLRTFLNGRKKVLWSVAGAALLYLVFFPDLELLVKLLE